MKKDTQRGERIKEERTRMALSQQKAADAVGVRREMWAKYEAGSEPGAEALASMRRMGVDVDYVLSGKTLQQRAAEAAAGMPMRLRALREAQGLEKVLKVAGVTAKQWHAFESEQTPSGYPPGFTMRLVEGFRLDATDFILGQHRTVTTSGADEVVLIENYRVCSPSDQEAIRHQAAFLAGRTHSPSTSLAADGRYPQREEAHPMAVHDKPRKKGA